jgi:hypothetical protein
LDNLGTHTRLALIRLGFTPAFAFKKTGWTQLASDTVYQFLAHVRRFSPASSTTKTGRHDIPEIFLKGALNILNQSIQISKCSLFGLKYIL